MFPRRFKDNHSQIDWPLLIQEINAAGWTNQQMEEATGIPKYVFQRIRSEVRNHPKEWDEAFKLVDLFVRVTHNDPLPLIK